MTIAHVSDDLADAMRRLRSYASSLERNDGEDLVQEALARAIANGVPVEAVPWLRTVMRRLAIDRSRRAREISSGDSFDMADLATDTYADPEAEVLTGERREAVRRALAALPARYREALLAYADHGQAAGVAQQMKLSSQATWTLLSRARDRLRTQLERGGFVPAFFAGKLPFWTAATSGAVAAALIVTTVVIPHHHPKAQETHKLPAITQTAAGMEQAVSTASNPAHVATPPRAAKATTRANAPKTATSPRYAADACAGGMDVMGVELHYEDAQPSTTQDLTGISIFDTIIPFIPDDARQGQLNGCQQ